MPRPRIFDTDQAIDAALDVFLRAGYDATSLDQLLDAMGIGSGSFYHTFGGKEDVYLKALRRWRDRSAAEEPGASLRGPLRGLARIRAFFHGLGERGARRGMPEVCLYMTAAVQNAGGDRKVSKITADGLHRVRELFRSAVEEGTNAGEVRSDLDSDHLASLLLCVTYGVQVMARAKAPAHTISEAIEATLSLTEAKPPTRAVAQPRQSR